MFCISKIVSADELINVYIQNMHRAAAASIHNQDLGRKVSVYSMIMEAMNFHLKIHPSV